MSENKPENGLMYKPDGTLNIYESVVQGTATVRRQRDAEAAVDAETRVQAALDAAVASVASSLESQFRTKVSAVHLYARRGAAYEPTIGLSFTSDVEIVVLRKFFLDLARNAVCGIEHIINRSE